MLTSSVILSSASLDLSLALYYRSIDPSHIAMRMRKVKFNSVVIITFIGDS